jgi:hypothetical protein
MSFVARALRDPDAWMAAVPRSQPFRVAFLRPREGVQVRDQQRDLFECRPLVLFEPEAEPAGGKQP